MHGQDIHLSHVHASPTILNPAMTGLFEGQARLIANSRSQWNSVTSGYKTVVGSADMKLVAVNKNDFVSGGIQLYSDRAGDLDFTTSVAAFSLAYLKAFDRNGRNFISFGIQNALIENRIDFSKIKTFDHIPAMNNSETLSKINYYDLNAGLAWFYKPSKLISLYLGLSAFHLNKPQVGFRNALSSENATSLYRRFNFHGGASIQISKEFSLKPSILFMNQGPHQEITLGTFVRYRTYRRGRQAKPLYYIYIGGWLRSHIEKDTSGVDALVASIKYEFRKFSLALSYDINVSSYRLASGGRGGLEFSLIRVFDWERKSNKTNKVKCPLW